MMTCDQTQTLEERWWMEQLLSSRILARICLAYLLTALCLWMTVATSSAQGGEDVQQAISLDREAKELIAKGEFYEATERYREALRIFEHPDLYINLALAEMKLGEFESAFSSCNKALNSPLLTPQAKAAATKCVGEAQAKMMEIRAVVSTYPNGARLRLDGRAIGQAPWNGILAPGRRQFDFELPGHVPMTRIVNAVPGARIKLQVRMIPQGMGGLITLRTVPDGANILIDNEFIGQSPIVAFPTSTGPHSVQLILKGHLPETQQIFVQEGLNQELNFYLKPERGQVSATDLWPAWGMISAGVLTSALAGYFGYQALSAFNDAERLALRDGRPEMYDRYRLSVRDMENAQQTSDILWVTSGTLVTSGLIWWLVAR